MKYLFFILCLFVMNLQAQNIELAGSPIQISVQGYKTGQMQWQSSLDKSTWSDVPNSSDPVLKYTLNRSSFFRLKIKTCDSIYYSDTTKVMAVKISDSSYAQNYESVFGLNDIKWCNVPVPDTYPQDQTHPSILYISNSWNGHNIWLATTPYPNDSYFENPSIYYSDYQNNELNTNFQPIANNPIVKMDFRGQGFNSDPDIFLDNSTMYCLSKQYLAADQKFHYILQSSQNGQQWTSPRDLFNSDFTGCEIVSPAIIKYNDKYRIYGAYTQARVSGGKFHNFVILESSSLVNPDFKIISRPTYAQKGNIEMWHFDVLEHNNVLYMVLCAKNTNFSNDYLSTYLAISFDYKNFYIFPKPLFNAIYTYRPTAFIDDNGKLSLIIATMDRTHRINSVNGNEIGVASIALDHLLDLLNE